MDIDFVSISRNLRSGAFSLSSTYPCWNIKNKVATRDRQMNTLSAIIVLTIFQQCIELFTEFNAIEVQRIIMPDGYGYSLYYYYLSTP